MREFVRIYDTDDGSWIFFYLPTFHLKGKIL